MPYTPQHKQQSRERILDSASRLFSRRGYDAVSIDDLMTDAGLTRGAFYNHFSDKTDVYTEAITHATINSPIAQQKLCATYDPASLASLLDSYLSSAHVYDVDPPCPLAFLVTDVGVREPRVRSTYTRVFCNMTKFVKKFLNWKDRNKRDETALALTAMMIGGVAISRALNDREVVEELLKCCRRTAKKLLEK